MNTPTYILCSSNINIAATIELKLYHQPQVFIAATLGWQGKRLAPQLQMELKSNEVKTICPERKYWVSNCKLHRPQVSLSSLR